MNSPHLGPAGHMPSLPHDYMYITSHQLGGPSSLQQPLPPLPLATAVRAHMAKDGSLDWRQQPPTLVTAAPARSHGKGVLGGRGGSSGRSHLLLQRPVQLLQLVRIVHELQLLRLELRGLLGRLVLPPAQRDRRCRC